MESGERRWNWALTAGCCVLLVVSASYLPSVWSLVEKWASVARDLLSLFLAAMAIKMGLDNEKVTDRQLGILQRLEELEGKQAALAEMQLRAAQLAPVLRLACRSSSSYDGADMSIYRYEIEIDNAGDKPAREVSWQVRYPEGRNYGQVDLNAMTSHSYSRGRQPNVENNQLHYQACEARFDGPLYPGKSAHLLQVAQTIGRADGSAVRLTRVEYALHCAEGRFPNRGFAELVLARGEYGSDGPTIDE